MCAQTGFIGREAEQALRDWAAWAALFDKWRCNGYFASVATARARLLDTFERRLSVALAGALAARVIAAEDIALVGTQPTVGTGDGTAEHGLWGDTAGDIVAEILARHA